MPTFNFVRWTLSVFVIAAALLLCSFSASRADLWPGGGPSLGGAIAAKAMSEACPHLLTDAEIADLDAYITRRRDEIAAINADDAASVSSFMPALESEYARAEKCTDAGEAMAKDMLERVQSWLDERD
jgi:hypothetical protein